MKYQTLARWRAAFVSISLGVLLSHLPTHAAEPGKSASLAGAMPSGAAGYAEVSGLGRVIQRIQGSSYLAAVTSSPQFQALQKSPQYAKAQAVRAIVEAQLGMDVWKALQGLFNDRLAVAVYPKEGNPAGNAVAMLRGADPHVLGQIRQRLEPFLTLVQEQIDSSESIAGAKVLSF